MKKTNFNKKKIAQLLDYQVVTNRINEVNESNDFITEQQLVGLTGLIYGQLQMAYIFETSNNYPKVLDRWKRGKTESMEYAEIFPAA